MTDGAAGPGAFVRRHGVRILTLLVAMAMIDVIWMAAAYLAYPGYLDHGEPMVAMTSWRLLDGAQAFPPLDGPVITANVYGPITYIVHALAFALFGSGIAVSKAAGLAAAVAVPFLVFAAQKGHGRAWALTAMLLAVGYVVLGVPMSVWNRPDPFLAFLVAAAVWAMNASRPDEPEWGKTAFIALAAGLAAGFKLHAGIYFVPVVVYHCWHRGFGAWALSGAVGAAAIALPFAFEPFSLASFLAWFPLFVGKETDPVSLAKVMRYLILYLAPVVLIVVLRKVSGGEVKKAEIAYIAAFVAAIAVVMPAAVKPGAGWYYLFPLLPVTVDLVVRAAAPMSRYSSAARFGIAILAILLFALSVPIQKRFQRALHWNEARQTMAEVREILSVYDGATIQMGAGESLVGYERTLYKPLLIFAGHPYTLDVGVAMESTALGVPISEAFRRGLGACHIRVWLIPAGQRPFDLVGYYGNPVFDPEFRSAFLDNYEKHRRFRYFDSWVCKKN